jgi:hypothetical protein
LHKIALRRQRDELRLGHSHQFFLFLKRDDALDRVGRVGGGGYAVRKFADFLLHVQREVFEQSPLLEYVAVGDKLQVQHARRDERGGVFFVELPHVRPHRHVGTTAELVEARIDAALGRHQLEATQVGRRTGPALGRLAGFGFGGVADGGLGFAFGQAERRTAVLERGFVDFFGHDLKCTFWVVSFSKKLKINVLKKEFFSKKLQTTLRWASVERFRSGKCNQVRHGSKPRCRSFAFAIFFEKT